VELQGETLVVAQKELHLSLDRIVVHMVEALAMVLELRTLTL